MDGFTIFVRFVKIIFVFRQAPVRGRVMKKENKQIEDPMFVKDPRYKISKKEALIGIILVIINFAWWFGFAYGFGSREYTEYQYILGFPDWFFYSCIGGLIVMSTLIYILVKFVFVEVPFEDEE